MKVSAINPVNPFSLYIRPTFPFTPFYIYQKLHGMYLMSKQRREQLIPQGLILKFLFRQNSRDVNESFHHVRISVSGSIGLNTTLPKISPYEIIVISGPGSFDYSQGAEHCQFNSIIIQISSDPHAICFSYCGTKLAAKMFVLLTTCRLQ